MPLYWIAPRVELLIAGQSLLFAVSVVPVFLFLRHRLPPGSSFALAGAYGLFWGLQRAAAFDVHEVAFAPLIIATAILAMDRRRWVLFWTSAFALTLVKEDLIPLLTFVGIYLVLQGERQKGAALIAASVAAFGVVVGITIPFFGAGGYSYGGPYAELLRRPWTIPAAFVTPPAKLLTALMWVAPFTLLPLLSPLAVLLVPFVMSRLLSDVSSHWGTTFHYSAPLAPILAMSAGDALARLARRVHDEQLRRRVVTGLSAASVLLSLFLPGNQPLWDLFEPGHYAYTPVHRTGYTAIQRVPQSASVVAQGAALPHLSQREQAYYFAQALPKPTSSSPAVNWIRGLRAITRRSGGCSTSAGRAVTRWYSTRTAGSCFSGRRYRSRMSRASRELDPTARLEPTRCLARGFRSADPSGTNQSRAQRRATPCSRHVRRCPCGTTRRRCPGHRDSHTRRRFRTGRSSGAWPPPPRCRSSVLGLFLPTRDRKDMRLQGQNGQAVVQLRGSLQVVDGFLEPTLLRVRHTLKGKGERGIRVRIPGPFGRARSLRRSAA